MAALDVSTASAALKTFYSKDRIENLMYKNRPFFAMVSKKEDFVGDYYKVPMKVANPQGGSSTFSEAQANKVGTNYKAWLLTRTKHYQLASIETELMLASANDAGAFLRIATDQIDGAIDNLTRTLAYQCYNDSNASIGVVGSITSGATPAVITLATPDDVVKFEVGQSLVAWTAASGGSQRAWATADTVGAVVAVDRNAGTITMDVNGNAAGITVVQGDYLFASGDRGLGISGLAAWLPSTAPTSAAFFNVDRTVDSSRLAGQRKDVSDMPIEEGVIEMARRIGREGGEPSHLFLSFDRYAALEKALGTKVRYGEQKVGEIAFSGLKINGPRGEIMVVADQDCPANRGYMLTLADWSLYCLGTPVRILDQDGSKMLREATADALEVRTAFYGNLGCRAPGNSGVMLF